MKLLLSILCQGRSPQKEGPDDVEASTQQLWPGASMGFPEWHHHQDIENERFQVGFST
jgi:hypothetical protein